VDQLSGKGQSSIEFLMVVGIAMAISSPFILAAQESVVDVRQGQRLVSLQNSLDRMDSAVSMVSAAGEPARVTFNMQIPSNVNESMVVQERAVVYTINTRGGVTNVSRVFDTNVSVTSDLPESEGTARMSAVAWDNQVNLTVVE
jgi:hypothetical protein